MAVHVEGLVHFEGLHQSLVFLFTTWKNISAYGFLLVYNLTNDNSGSHQNIGIHFV